MLRTLCVYLLARPPARCTCTAPCHDAAVPSDSGSEGNSSPSGFLRYRTRPLRSKIGTVYTGTADESTLSSAVDVGWTCEPMMAHLCWRVVHLTRCITNMFRRETHMRLLSSPSPLLPPLSSSTTSRSTVVANRGNAAMLKRDRV